MTLTWWAGCLCPGPVCLTIATTCYPYEKSRAFHAHSSVVWGLGPGSTEVSIVAGWQLGLTCRAQEVGPGA